MCAVRMARPLSFGRFTILTKCGFLSIAALRSTILSWSPLPASPAPRAPSSCYSRTEGMAARPCRLIQRSWPALHGDLEAVKCLLDHGANVKAKTQTGFTALIAASLSGNAKVVALLLERGADPNAVCELERGILQTPAGVAASMGYADCLRLLMAAGADVNAQGGPFKHNAVLGAATTASKE